MTMVHGRAKPHWKRAAYADFNFPDMTDTIVTRYAPSPTGFLHIG